MVQILSFVKNIYIEYNYQNDLNWAISFLLLNVSVSNDKGQQNKQNLFDLDIKRKPSLWEIQCDLHSMCRCSQAVDKLLPWFQSHPGILCLWCQTQDLCQPATWLCSLGDARGRLEGWRWEKEHVSSCLPLAPFCDVLAVVSIPALIVCLNSHSGSHFAVQTTFLEPVWLDSFGTSPSWQAPVLWDLGPSSEASLSF